MNSPSTITEPDHSTSKPSGSVEAPEPFSALVQVDVSGLSHPGKTRPNNEDHFLIGRVGRFMDVVMTNVPPDDIMSRADEIGYGMVVADGMGGYTGGEVASRIAIRTLINLILRVPDWIFRPNDAWSAEILKRITAHFQKIDLEIARLADQNPELARMGTTMTGAYSVGANLFITHVGDSRAYHLSGGEFSQLTHDQTLAQTLIDMKVMSREEAASSRLRHALTQALGKQGGKVKCDVQRMRLKHGDTVLLCTDGLTEMVDEARIRDVLKQNAPAADICQQLFDLALDGGGRDNITVIVARYQFPDSIAPA